MLHGVRIEPELRRQLLGRRQRLPRLEDSHSDAPLHLVCNLAVGGTRIVLPQFDEQRVLRLEVGDYITTLVNYFTISLEMTVSRPAWPGAVLVRSMTRRIEVTSREAGVPEPPSPIGRSPASGTRSAEPAGST